MQIPRSYIENYSNSLNQISATARESLSKALMQLNYDADIAGIRNAVIAVMQTACGASSDLSARLAADFYDGLRLQFGIDDGYQAEVDSGRIPEATDGAVRAFVQDLVDDKPIEQFVGKCVDRLDYETRKAANECVAKNAKNDPEKPRWARVPTGVETCQFCIMLASRGFVYHSEETASHAHAHCDCRVIPSWDKSPTAQGYDPDLYYDMWKHPEKYAQQAEESASHVITPRKEEHRAEKQTATNTVENRQETKEAVEYYASGEGMYVNQFIRRGQYDSLTDSEKELVKKLDEATKADVIDVPKLYRSVDASSVFGNMSVGDYESLTDGYVYDDDYAIKKTQAIRDRAKPGKVITERGFMSTSEDYDVVSEWYDFTGSDKAITLELTVPDGTRGCKVYELTPEAEESDPQREVLLPRNTKYQITEITSKDGLIYVKAKIVG